MICHLHSHLAQWDQAIEHCRLAAQGLPNVWYPHVDLVFANAWLGRDADAKVAAANFLKLMPGYTVQSLIEVGKKVSDNPVYNQQIGHTTSEAKSVPRARTLSSRAAC